ncbi:MAG: hypothetical protein FWD53_06420 [Phycisphaerales bacterium]|nr:hypothetical protein [Phycisphaerales bacterium]
MIKIAITQPDLQKMVEEKVSSLRQQVSIGVQQADRGEFTEFTAEDIIQRETRTLQSQSDSPGRNRSF